MWGRTGGRVGACGARDASCHSRPAIVSECIYKRCTHRRKFLNCRCTPWKLISRVAPRHQLFLRAFNYLLVRVPAAQCKHTGEAAVINWQMWHCDRRRASSSFSAGNFVAFIIIPKVTRELTLAFIFVSLVCGMFIELGRISFQYFAGNLLIESYLRDIEFPRALIRKCHNYSNWKFFYIICQKFLAQLDDDYCIWSWETFRDTTGPCEKGLGDSHRGVS